MKKFAILLLCLVVVVALAACGQPAEEPETEAPAVTEGEGETEGEAEAVDFTGQNLVVTTWGGTYHESLVATQAAFEEMTGATLEFVLGDAPIDQMAAEGEQVSVDVCHLDLMLVDRGREYGLWETLDTSKLANAELLYDQAWNAEGDSVVTNWGFYGMEYNREFVEDGAVTSWLDYWDPAYADAKLHIPAVTDAGQYWVDIVARAMGFEGIHDTSCWDALFEEMAALKPSIGLINNDHAAIETYITNGDVWVAVETNGRALNLVKDGFDIGFAKAEDGSPTMTTWVSITKHTQVKDLAYAYVDWLLDVDSQTRFMEFNSYNPSNSTIEIPEDLQGYMLKDENEVAALIQYDTYGFEEVKNDFMDRWNGIFGS